MRTLTPASFGLALLLVMIAGRASAQDSGTAAYNLEPGAQLEYETSASLKAEGDLKESQQARLRAIFTVIEANDHRRTIFTAADEAAAQANAADGTSARFSFQLSRDGRISERKAGYFRPVFTGWEPGLYFPPIPETGQTTVSVKLLMIDRQVELPVSVTSQEGKSRIVIENPPAQSAYQSGGARLLRYRWEVLYDPAERSVLSSVLEQKFQMRDHTGRETIVDLNFHSARKAKRKLETAELAKLKEDIAAGIAAFEQARRGAIADNAAGAADPVEQYLGKFPQGQFAAPFSEVAAQRKLQTKMTENARRIKEGVKAPNFSAKSIDGETVRLSDLRGKVVLLDFWATWCPPCVMEIPNLKRLYEKYRDSGFTIVGISADKELEDLQEFVNERDVNWKQIFSPPEAENSVVVQYGVYRFPTTILLDREGTIRLMDVAGPELDNAISELVNER